MRYADPTVFDRLRERKRLVAYLLSFVVVVGVQTVLYWWGMTNLEGDPRSLSESLGVVVQSLTTTGYGQDAPWESPFLQALVIVAQFTGVAYIFVAFPLFIVPWIRDIVVEPTVPDAIEDIDDHVVLCGYSSLYTTLIDDLETDGTPYVILESDNDRARELHESGRNVIQGESTSGETLRNVNVEDARAFVVDSRRVDGIDVALTIREFDEDVEILCLIDDPGQSQYLRYAGATDVLSPKHRLGKSLADKVHDAVSTDLDDEIDVDVGRFRVSEDSDIYGRKLERLDELADTGVTFLGAWIRGEFVTSFGPEDYVDETTVLVAAGTEAQLESVAEMTRSPARFPQTGSVIVAGRGITGTTAEGILRKAGRQVTTIDTEPDEGVDVVGDATDIESLHEAGIDDAQTVILALSEDRDALLATLVTRRLNPNVEIVVAAHDISNTNKLYRAGADFVLALPKVTGRMITLDLLEEDVMVLREQIQLAQIDVSSGDGELPDVDESRPGADPVVVAVRRGGEIDTDIDDGEVGEVTEEDDQIIVAGTDESVDKFRTELSRQIERRSDR